MAAASNVGIGIDDWRVTLDPAKLAEFDATYGIVSKGRMRAKKDGVDYATVTRYSTSLENGVLTTHDVVELFAEMHYELRFQPDSVLRLDSVSVKGVLGEKVKELPLAVNGDTLSAEYRGKQVEAQLTGMTLSDLTILRLLPQLDGTAGRSYPFSGYLNFDPSKGLVEHGDFRIESAGAATTEWKGRTVQATKFTAHVGDKVTEYFVDDQQRVIRIVAESLDQVLLEADDLALRDRQLAAYEQAKEQARLQRAERAQATAGRTARGFAEFLKSGAFAGGKVHEKQPFGKAVEEIALVNASSEGAFFNIEITRFDDVEAAWQQSSSFKDKPTAILDGHFRITGMNTDPALFEEVRTAWKAFLKKR